MSLLLKKVIRSKPFRYTCNCFCFFYSVNLSTSSIYNHRGKLVPCRIVIIFLLGTCCEVQPGIGHWRKQQFSDQLVGTSFQHCFLTSNMARSTYFQRLTWIYNHVDVFRC